MKKAIAVAAVLMLGFSLTASASVVYSKAYNLTGSWISDVELPQAIADDFQLTGNTNLTDVHWWGTYGLEGVVAPAPTLDNFTINFYEVNGSAIGTQIASYAAGNVTRTDTGNTMSGTTGDTFPIYAYSYDLSSPLALSGGVTYAVAIINSTPEGNGPWGWEQTDAGNTNIWGAFDVPATAWNNIPLIDVAFELTDDARVGAVPEPISATLFVGSVLVGLGRLRRRAS